MNVWTALAKFASFETQHAVCRPVVFEDRQAFFALVSDPDNARFILPVTTDATSSDQLLVEAFMKQPLGIWAVADKASGAFIGLIRFEALDEGKGRAELGYVLHKACWGQGIMTELVKTLSFLAFQELGLRCLAIICHQENLASQAVAKKAGFRLVKTYRGSDRYSHQIRTYQLYQLTKGDYRYE